MADCTVTLNIGDGPDEAVHPGDVLIHRVIEGVSGGLDILPKALKPVPLRRDPFATVDLERGKVFRFEFTRHKMTFYKLIPDAPTALYSSLVDATPPPVAPIPTGAELADQIAEQMVGNYVPIDGSVPVTGAPLRVGTLNLRFKSNVDDVGVTNRQWSDRRPRAAQDVIDSGVAILAMQETSSVDDGTLGQQFELVSSVNTLLGATRWQTHTNPAQWYQTVAWDTNRVTQIGSFSRVDINPVGPVSMKRSIVGSEFEVVGSGQRFWFFSQHWNYEAAPTIPLTQAWAEAAGIIATEVVARGSSGTVPVVVAGDTNSVGGAAISTLANAKIRDARRESPSVAHRTIDTLNSFDATMAARQRSSWIDHVFMHGPVKVDAMGQVLKFVSGSTPPLTQPLPSDHNLVWADLRIGVTS
ncbi:MAG: hypothetical protein EOP24_32135 [Hyphomicrobiales bacterium]|nr:MAG: hypothetical protein EOP24_32135 [Hyphomicrobiales bacterium]